MNQLENVVLITGGGQRIGYFLVKKFLQEANYPVVFTYRTDSILVKELRGLGALAIQMDFTVEGALPDLVKRLTIQVKSLRAIIHNASLWLADEQLKDTKGSYQLDLSVMKTLMQIHVEAPYYLNYALIPLLQASNANLKDIISISDDSVNRVSNGHIAYLASKSALQTLCKGFAKKLAPQIKVNDIAPALIIFNKGDDSLYKERRLAQSALGIEPGPEVVWQAVSYLMNSPYTTGTILPLEGGRCLL